MRIPDDLLECVCFLCVEKPLLVGSVWKYGGTAFFVRVPNEQEDRLTHVYLVTARHCVDECARQGLDMHVRMNTLQGGTATLRIRAPWTFPEDDSADVAVIPWAPPRDRFQYKTCDLDLLMTPEVIREQGVGPGDELVITGLFTARYGQQRNLPIVRTGIIAAMPGEPLQDEDTGLEYPAYIAEVRSIGGLSGSPVFWCLEPGRVHPTTMKIELRREMRLLGIVRGHWDLKKKVALAFSDNEIESVNMGMALITPIEELSKLLMGEGFVKERARVAREWAKEHAPTKDGAFVADEATPQFTKDDFEQALKKVAKKLPDSEKAQTSDE